MSTEPRVLLSDGREVSTWSPEWKQECLDRHLEAQKLLQFATREIRIEHLDGYERRYGAVARKRLETETRRIWDMRQARLIGTPSTTTESTT